MADRDLTQYDLCGVYRLQGDPRALDCPPEPDYFWSEIAALIFVLAVIGAAGYAARKFGLLSRLYKWRRQILAGLSAWAIWLLCIFSYSTLFDERIDFFLWAVLPPGCVLSMVVWVNYFLLGKKGRVEESEEDALGSVAKASSISDVQFTKSNVPKSSNVATHCSLMFALGFIFNLTLKGQSSGWNVSLQNISESVGGGLAVLLIGWLFVRYVSVAAGWISVAVVIAFAYIGR